MREIEANVEASELFAGDYDFALYDARVDEELFEKMKNAILGTLVTPETKTIKIDVDTAVITLAANMASLVQACVMDEASGCVLSNKLARYFHDCVHVMCRQGFADQPKPNVSGHGQA